MSQARTKDSRSERRSSRHVPAGLYWKSRLFDHSSRLWRWLSRVESGMLADELRDISIDRPLYIAGVARSGTTIITEMLTRHPDVTSHRYSDFPNVYTPYWRNWLADRVRGQTRAPVERAHKDGLMVTNESPEAVEEVLWMQFFDHLHDPSRSHVLDAATSNPEFEAFYRDHIRKLLLVRGRSRYLAKGNYNTTRLGYLLDLFPDARFIVPVRNPVNHIASLVKQDRLFERLAGEDPRVPAHLHRSGHFEFGPDKRCIHAGDDRQALGIHQAWNTGQLVRGWALYWDCVYAHLKQIHERDRKVRNAVLFVRYEDLCRDTESTLDAILAHCALDPKASERVRAEYVDKLNEPDYYAPDFSPETLGIIREVTGVTAQWYGYG